MFLTGYSDEKTCCFSCGVADTQMTHDTNYQQKCSVNTTTAFLCDKICWEKNQDKQVVLTIPQELVLFNKTFVFFIAS